MSHSSRPGISTMVPATDGARDRMGARRSGTRSRLAAALALPLALLAFAASACGPPIGVKRIDPRLEQRRLTATVLSTGRLSNGTQNRLRQHDLTERFAAQPEVAIALLHNDVVGGSGDSDDICALAELSFFHAVQSGKQSYFLAAAVYAYAFLFPDPPAAPPEPFDPRLRLAADLYNRGITLGLTDDEGATLSAKAGTYALPFGSLEVDVPAENLVWQGRWLVRLVPVADLEVTGLRNRYRQAGIGAPLLASTEPRDPHEKLNDYLGKRARIEVTALLRIPEPRRQLAQQHVRSTLEVYPNSTGEAVAIDDRHVPLEAEPSAALAAALAESPVWERELAGFFRDVIGQHQLSRLLFVTPYQRGKIPVVFVHGTASSPGRWADMLNDLMDDSAIRERYQFWFFMYDTGSPIAYSGALLRGALEEAIERVDPTRNDPALRQMVVVGHSQGGLLTKMTAVDTGDALWASYSSKPFDPEDFDPDDRALAQRVFFVKPLPFVRRVVFIATPHRGSYLTLFSVAKWVRSFIRLPSEVLRIGARVARLSRGAEAATEATELPTSLDNMTPGNRFIKTLSAIPLAPGVGAHSIIAVNGDGEPEDGDDGVVAYSSAHIDGVESELVVRSSHSCQANPYVIGEVRRILLENAGVTGAR